MDVQPVTPAASAPEVPGYRVGAALGQGARGQVWSAVRDVDRAPVALKIVEADARALARELDAARSLLIEHVVPVHGLVELGDGRCAVVMDVMAGGSLREIVSARGHLSAGEVVTVLVPIASALGALHSHGVVHGDVSPDNVLLDLRGRPALADLGASHAVGQSPADVWGTDGFVAPEVLLGGLPRAASDVYAVACLGLYLLTGSVPEAALLRAPLDEWIVAAGRPDLRGHPFLEVLREALAPEATSRPEGARLAEMAYAAAAPEPLVLLRDGDAVSGLTRRLRGVLPDAGADDEGPGCRRGLHRAPAQGAGARSTRGALTRAARREWASAARGSWSTRLARLSRIRPVTMAAIIGVAVTVLLGGVAVAKTPWAHRGGAVESATSSTTASDGGADGGAAVLRARTPSETDVRRIVQVLADRRAEQWSSAAVGASPVPLTDVTVEGSPARAQDAADLTAMAQDGIHLEGVRLQVVTVAAQPAAASDELVVRTTSVVSAHEIVRPTGRESAPEGSAEVVDLLLKWTADGWRVWDVHAV